MKKVASLLAIAGFAVAGYSVAFAADTSSSSGGDRGAWRQACGADIKQYCGDKTTREDRHACVEANKDKFSDGCKTFMASHPRPQGGSSSAPSGQ